MIHLHRIGIGHVYEAQPVGSVVRPAPGHTHGVQISRNRGRGAGRNQSQGLVGRGPDPTDFRRLGLTQSVGQARLARPGPSGKGGNQDVRGVREPHSCAPDGLRRRCQRPGIDDAGAGPDRQVGFVQEDDDVVTHW